MAERDRDLRVPFLVVTRMLILEPTRVLWICNGKNCSMQEADDR